MPRLRQQNPQAYGSTANINSEFESLIRYINSAELGNKTIGELLAQLFDTDGIWAGPVQIRFDAANGLEYRVGSYTDDSEGWLNVSPSSTFKGAPGENVGAIEGPFIYNRQDTVATASQTVIPYTVDSNGADILVYKNGLLLRDHNSAYTWSDTAVTLASGASVNDLITIWTVRDNPNAVFRRSDVLATAGQVVFSFLHEASEHVLVYKNGILQREGVSYDYTQSPTSGTVTFTSALLVNDLVTMIVADNTTTSNVPGIMLTEGFCNEDGFITYDRIAVEDGEIPQAKVSGLATLAANRPKVTVGSGTPSSPTAGDLWVDTSATPNQLKFYSGSVWVTTNPATTLPTFTSSNANQYVRLNGTGTAYELGNIDFSSLVPQTYMGAANGVASLDSDGKLPTDQLPEIFAVQMLDKQVAGTLSNTTVLVQRIYRQKVRIDGITRKTGSGTCSVQLSVDGVAVGSVYGVTTTAADTNFGTVIEVDGTTASRRIELIISSASGSDLEVGLSGSVLST